MASMMPCVVLLDFLAMSLIDCDVGVFSFITSAYIDKLISLISLSCCTLRDPNLIRSATAKPIALITINVNIIVEES